MCACCQRDARFVAYRPRTACCLFGEVRVKRAYYHCRDCRGGQTPWDQKLGLGPRLLTPAVAQLTALAGALTSFAQASERTLRKMTGLRVSESTVERTTEDAGARVGRLLEERLRFAEDRVWPWQRDTRRSIWWS